MNEVKQDFHREQTLDLVAISASAMPICNLMARFPSRSAAALEPVGAIRHE